MIFIKTFCGSVGLRSVWFNDKRRVVHIAQIIAVLIYDSYDCYVGVYNIYTLRSRVFFCSYEVLSDIWFFLKGLIILIIGITLNQIFGLAYVSSTVTSRPLDVVHKKYYDLIKLIKY